MRNYTPPRFYGRTAEDVRDWCVAVHAHLAETKHPPHMPVLDAVLMLGVLAREIKDLRG